MLEAYWDVRVMGRSKKNVAKFPGKESVDLKMPPKESLRSKQEEQHCNVVDGFFLILSFQVLLRTLAAPTSFVVGKINGFFTEHAEHMGAGDCMEYVETTKNEQDLREKLDILVPRMCEAIRRHMGKYIVSLNPEDPEDERDESDLEKRKQCG